MPKWHIVKRWMTFFERKQLWCLTRFYRFSNRTRESNPYWKAISRYHTHFLNVRYVFSWPNKKRIPNMSMSKISGNFWLICFWLSKENRIWNVETHIFPGILFKLKLHGWPKYDTNSKNTLASIVKKSCGLNRFSILAK